MSELNIKIQKLHPDAKLPHKTHFEDAGWDLFALENTSVLPGSVRKVRTGIAMSIPKGHVGLIWDKSGLGSQGLKIHGGVIDSTYTGEIFVCVNNLEFDIEDYDFSQWHYNPQTGEEWSWRDEPIPAPSVVKTEYFDIEAGQKVAQLLIQEIPLHINWQVVDELVETDRGSGGFGSTGK